MTPVLEVRCLGRLSLGCREAAGAVASQLPLPATLKAQSLLAYLVVRRTQPHTRDHLAELFWGDRPEHNARRSLATALWQIRRCLPPGDFLETDVATVQFNPRCPCWLDVGEFERLLSPRVSTARPQDLQQAIDLYRGPFLDGFYDDWVLNERYRLESVYCDALAQLMSTREALGQFEAALAVALWLLDQDPLREDAHRAAMRAYCRLGNRAAALAQYARCEQALKRELGAPPMAETIALRAAVLEGRLEHAPVQHGVPEPVSIPARPEPAQHPLDAAVQAPLVGREQELHFLVEGWQAALAGACSLLLVSGEAGVGKTRLVKDFADQLRWQGVSVLEGRCYEFERLLPYQPIAEALGSFQQALTGSTLPDLPTWVLSEVARLAPDPKKRAAVAPGSATMSAGAETQERLFGAVARLLEHAAHQQPLLLILEDLHWGADSTLQLLHHLARSLSGASFLILGTLRLEAVDPTHPLSTLARRLERDGIARRLQLERLSQAMVASLVGRMSGAGEMSRPLADRLYQETEGNPFYLIQTLKALFEQGAIQIGEGAWRADYAGLGGQRLPLPSGIAETIAARVARLSENTQDALGLAVVAGREFDFEVLKRAWARGEEATLSALDELLRHRLIVEGSGGASADYAFMHHKIQEVVYEGLPRHRRYQLHRKVGLAMERWLGDSGGARPVELAYHFEQAWHLDATLADKAVVYLLEAGRQAERQSANQEAIEYLQRGLGILRSLAVTPQRQRQELELQIALAVPTTVVRGYASPETKAVYSRAKDLCQQTGETSVMFTSLAGLARYYGVTGDNLTNLEIAKELLAIAEPANDVDMLMEAYRQIGGPCFALGNLKEARAFYEAGLGLYDPHQHERLAYRFGHDPAATFHGTLGLVLWLLGYPDHALDQAQRLLRLLDSFSHPTSQVVAHCWLAKHAYLRRDAEFAGHHAEEAIRLGQVHAARTWPAVATVLRGWALVEQGWAAEGLAQLTEGITAWRATGFAHFVPFFLALQAESCLKAHRLNEALAALTTARSMAQEGGDRYWSAEVDRLQGEFERTQGKADSTAEGFFLKALETARQQEARMLELRAALSLARLWQSQGKTEVARGSLRSIYESFTEGFGTPELRAASEMLRALS